MKRKIIPLVVLTILALSTLAALPVSAAPDNPIVVAHLKGALEPDLQLQAMMNLSWVDWRVVLDEITASDLDGASVLMMSLSDSSVVYSAAELSAINAWMNQGGKTIYVSADSDYGTDHLRIYQANAVLEAIGAKIRIDDCSAEDATSNGGAPYRVLGVSDNVAPEMAFLVAGVERGLFHGPGIVVGYDGGSYVNLMEGSIDDVYVIMTTSETGVVVDNSEPTPNVMTAGSEGEFPLLVAQVDYAKGNTIFAAGEAPFDQYMGLYAPEMIRADRYGADANPQQGQYLVENILKYGTAFGATILDQASSIMDLEDEVTGLEDDVASLTSEVTDLQDDVSASVSTIDDLESQVTSLESNIASLESDLTAAQSSASTMQLAAVAALVIGVVVGYFVGPMLKKQ